MKKNLWKATMVVAIVLSAIAVSSCTKKEGNGGNSEASTPEYPKRPIELVVPFGEGGASDIFARKFAEIMSANMSQPVQPVNKSGSGGLVGMVYSAGQKNDGYTIMSITPSHVIADVMGVAEVKLMEDFEPLCRIQSDIYILGVSKESRFSSVEELITYGQTDKITVAGISPGGLDDLTLAALGEATGITIQYIPYKSGSQVKAAALGGEVDIYLDKIVSAINYIKDGSIKPILVLNDKRIDKIDELKDVPCTVELGADVTIGSWRGFVIKKGAPEEVKSYLIDVMKKAYDTTEYQDFAEQNLVNIRSGYLNAEEFRSQWDEEFALFEGIASKLGLI